MEKGYLALILHAHLPFVRHPELEHGALEEYWYYEAMLETYLPLIKMMEDLYSEGTEFKLTMVLSPTLTAMFKDQLLQERFGEHLERSIILAKKELDRRAQDPERKPLAEMYHHLFTEAREIYHSYQGDLTTAFSRFQGLSSLELITCAATHSYLPLISTEEGKRAQIGLAVDQHTEVYGERPRGFWLPECGYRQGLERIIGDYGLEYFCLEHHGLLYAAPRPKYGPFSPIITPAGVAAFGRDPESSKQVWSASEGYPGDYQYREFYRDIGYEEELDYLQPFFPDGFRKQTGIKYHRITGPGGNKEIYNQEEGRRKAEIHAGNFIFNRQQQINFLADRMDGVKPVITAPYDAELFGHWWFEGPVWLKEVLRKSAADQRDYQLITPGEYLDQNPKLQLVEPESSSWGYKGYHEVWLEGSNAWIYRHLHRGERMMKELREDFIKAEGREKRALDQALRELLLAQSSDWAFIMKTGTMVEYAHQRTKNHLHNFQKLYHSLKKGRPDVELARCLKERNPLFPELDYRYFSDQRINKKAYL